MGFSTRAYHFYGLNVPEDQWTGQWAQQEGEMLDSVIAAVRDHAPDVVHTSAGDYDQDMLFLSIATGTSSTVKLGSYRKVTHLDAQAQGWDDQLRIVAEAMGYTNLGTPGWITVPDVS